MAFSPLDKQKEAEREVAMRRSAYPKWVKAGRMKQAEADMRIACMAEIAADYARMAAGEKASSPPPGECRQARE